MEKLTAERVFGQSGIVFPKIVSAIVQEGMGTPYSFTEIEEFQKFPPKRMMRTYWSEILYRAHWAAISSLIRHKRWFDACFSHSISQPNFLAFCSSLRGLVESAADTFYSLGAIPESIAAHSSAIAESLTGKADYMAMSQELEDSLIHFHFARRLNKSDKSLPTHKAESATKYIASIDGAGSSVKELYAELCQVVHPAAQSLHWLTSQKRDNIIVIDEPNDVGAIADLCTRHMTSIEWVQQYTVNIGIFILKVINAFSIKKLHTESVRRVETTSINLHRKIETAFSNNNIRWDS